MGVFAVELDSLGEWPTVLGVEAGSCDMTLLVTPWVASEVSCWQRRCRIFDKVVDGAIFI